MQRDIHVYKFGGASVRDAEAVRNVGRIVQEFGASPAVIVVSAMGKMTNALERLAEAYFERSEQTSGLFEEIRNYHWEVASALFPADHEVFTLLNDHFVEIEWVLEDEPDANFDYVYDQIVSVGELLATRIVHALLVDQGVNAAWLDARDVIKTDNTYREARVNWQSTQQRVDQVIRPMLAEGGFILTQGFIGCTSENFSITLGREGSDYSAGILAYCLDAVALTIWKDVPGVLTADPKAFDNVQLIERLTYREAVEMTYYGAKVIHPKTIKPLQNKQIPLYVRSFVEPGNSGTWIGTDLEAALPPVIVHDRHQALVHISVKDYSFVAEHHLSELFALFARCRIKINLMRNTAISFTVCCSYHADRIAAFKEAIPDNFNVVVDTGLSLYTIRHATPAAIDALMEDKVIVLEERFKDTVQFAVRDLVVARPR